VFGQQRLEAGMEIFGGNVKIRRRSGAVLGEVVGKAADRNAEMNGIDRCPTDWFR
jgi:hypothetical protein